MPDAKKSTVNGEVATSSRRPSADGANNRGDAAVALTAKRRAPTKKASPKQHTASIVSAPEHVVPHMFVDAVAALERYLKMPVWSIIHDMSGDHMFDESLTQAFYRQRQRLPRAKPMAIIVNSPGGHARSAFHLAMLIRRHCESFTVLVPRYCKSAATLFALGADRIILGGCGELGPLDAQFEDPEKEEYSSALNEVQALQRLEADALHALDQTMNMLVMRTHKKVETLLPHALKFVSDMMRPLLENLDAVHYTQMARALKVAEAYGIRLLRPKYPQREAERIARYLVEAYPEHSFVIDEEEAGSFGLQTEAPSPDVAGLLDTIGNAIEGRVIVGELLEVPTHA